MANVNVSATRLLPQAGADNDGQYLALVDSVAKASQNDTFTVTNASSVQVLSLLDDTTGAFEAHTVNGAVVTMTSATTGAKTALLLVKA